jgi:hypothetical protein
MSTKAWAVERGEFAKPSDRFGSKNEPALAGGRRVAVGVQLATAIDA